MRPGVIPKAVSLKKVMRVQIGRARSQGTKCLRKGSLGTTVSQPVLASSGFYFLAIMTYLQYHTFP
ncbi:hypothetical protein BDN67DRAFT_961637 [Paxillus ammoniavirescens]|nr:hypothetical protein BDN67DRAFT_961637 [Paxillus ammoniavirescens]